MEFKWGKAHFLIIKWILEEMMDVYKYKDGHMQ